MKNENYIIIDCSSIIYASFYAYGSLSLEGKNTGVIFGFLTKILKLAKDLDSNRVFYCFDHGESKREEIYPQYKEKRKKKRLKLNEQEQYEYNLMKEQAIDLHDNALPKLGFRNIFQQSGYESDDLMAVLVNIFKEQNKKIIMVTSDNDMYQLLEFCDIFNPSILKFFTKKNFMDKYKVHPSQWSICKSIGGCESDEVIGIVGAADPKKETSKALKYVLGDLKKGKIFERIESEEGQKIIERNLKLVKLPYEGTREIILRRDKVTKQKFLDVFNKYKFKSFLEPDKFREWERVFLK
jgi:5'-3' exonuclease